VRGRTIRYVLLYCQSFLVGGQVHTAALLVKELGQKKSYLEGKFKSRKSQVVVKYLFILTSCKLLVAHFNI